MITTIKNIAVFLPYIPIVVIIILYYFKEKHFQKNLGVQKSQFDRKLFETSVLNKLQENIGYSLNIKSIVEEVGSHLENFFILSSFSYAVIDENRIHLKNYIKEPLSKEYLAKTKEIMLSAICEIDDACSRFGVEEEIIGTFAEGEMSKPLSYFNVPLIINGKLTGILTISSKIGNIYKNDEMDFLYELVMKITTTIEKIESIIETEKGKLSSMLASLPNGAIMFLLSEGTFKASFINDAAKSFLRISDEPNTVRIMSAFGVVIDLIKEIKTVLREKKPVAFNDVNLYDKFFKILLSPVFLYRSSSIIGVSITMQDMTIEKEVQKVREDFTHMLVHEMRAPLVSMKGAAELLCSGKLDHESFGKMTVMIKNQTMRMLEQVGEILDVAKIEAGKFSIMKGLADFVGLAKKKTEEFSYAAGQKSIVIETDLTADIPLFEFDEERIGQVLNNLLSNSIKFTDTGGKIEVGARLMDHTLQAWVKDNGFGIPKEKQSLLFSRYTQVNKEGREQGTGLGLYIIKSIIDSHEGRIWIESQEGRGTAFYFSLPLINPQERKEKTASFIKPQEAVMVN